MQKSALLAVELAQDAELRSIVDHASALAFPARITRAVLSRLDFPILGMVHGARRGRGHGVRSIASSKRGALDYIAQSLQMLWGSSSSA
jgi:hypothetical protein